jgi:hypothetical protein
MKELFKKLAGSKHHQQHKVIARLLNKKEITAEEAILLMQEVNITVYVANAEMSSGAKIVGGHDLENNRY